MRASIAEFRDAYGAVTERIRDRYGVAVELANIEPPLKGDLDGSRILVADHNTDEERTFLVVHRLRLRQQSGGRSLFPRSATLHPSRRPPRRIGRTRMNHLRRSLS
jgi:hypothetical protein